MTKLLTQIKTKKTLFCNKVIRFLATLITKCSAKEEMEEIDKEIENINKFRDFSDSFFQNKDDLQRVIELEIEEKNRAYRVILSLHSAILNDDIEQLNSIFRELNLEEYRQKINQ